VGTLTRPMAHRNNITIQRDEIGSGGPGEPYAGDRATSSAAWIANASLSNSGERSPSYGNPYDTIISMVSQLAIRGRVTTRRNRNQGRHVSPPRYSWCRITREAAFHRLSSVQEAGPRPYHHAPKPYGSTARQADQSDYLSSGHEDILFRPHHSTETSPHTDCDATQLRRTRHHFQFMVRGATLFPDPAS